VIKKTIFALDIIAFLILIFTPALFVPAYFFDREVSTVAILGAGHPPYVIMTAEKAKWGNFLFPLLTLLIICNFYYLFAFLKKRLRKKQI
jgi:hypothetical protein